MKGGVFDAFAPDSTVVNKFTGSRAGGLAVDGERCLLNPCFNAQGERLAHRHLAGEFVFVALPREAELAGSGEADIMSAVGRIALQQDLPRLFFRKGDPAFEERAHFKRLQRCFHKAFASVEHKATFAFRVDGGGKAAAVTGSILQRPCSVKTVVGNEAACSAYAAQGIGAGRECGFVRQPVDCRRAALFAAVGPGLFGKQRQCVKKAEEEIRLRQTGGLFINVIVPKGIGRAEHLRVPCGQGLILAFFQANFARVKFLVNHFFVEEIGIAALVPLPVWHHIEQMVNCVDELIAQPVHLHTVRPVAGPEVHLHVFDRFGENLRFRIVFNPG